MREPMNAPAITLELHTNINAERRNVDKNTTGAIALLSYTMEYCTIAIVRAAFRILYEVQDNR